MSRFLIIAAVLVAVAAFSAAAYSMGYRNGRKWAVIESYEIGFDQGYNTGVSDAAAAVKSGGLFEVDP